MKDQKDILDFIKPNRAGVPDSSYFDNLADEIIAKNKTKIIPLYKKPIVWLSTAAAVVIVIALFNFNGNSLNVENPLLALNEIPTKDVVSYIDDNIDEFDTEMIVEFISEENMDTESNYVEVIEEQESYEPIESISFDDIDEQDILNYFNEEEIELSDLEDESFI